MLFELKQIKMWKKITIGVILFLIVGGISFFVGGVIGFVQGFGYRTVLIAPTEGLLTVSLLKAIREGRIDTGVDLLEASLDSHIIEYSTRKGQECLLFDMFCMSQYDGTFMERIAKYRKQYPTKATDTEVKKRIEQTLKKYETTDGGNK